MSTALPSVTTAMLPDPGHGERAKPKLRQHRRTVTVGVPIAGRRPGSRGGSIGHAPGVTPTGAVRSGRRCGAARARAKPGEPVWCGGAPTQRSRGPAARRHRSPVRSGDRPGGPGPRPSSRRRLGRRVSDRFLPGRSRCWVVAGGGVQDRSPGRGPERRADGSAAPDQSKSRSAGRRAGRRPPGRPAARGRGRACGRCGDLRRPVARRVGPSARSDRPRGQRAGRRPGRLGRSDTARLRRSPARPRCRTRRRGRAGDTCAGREPTRRRRCRRRDTSGRAGVSR